MSIKRSLCYIWPQWPRLVVATVMAAVVAVLLSLSFMAVVPILKVVLESDGLHAWIDQQYCLHGYGIKFLEGHSLDQHQLLIAHVYRNSLAESAGLRTEDRIVGLQRPAAPGYSEQMPRAELLHELAGHRDKAIELQVRRSDSEPDVRLRLHTPWDEAFAKSLNWDRLGTWRWVVSWRLAHAAQHMVSVLPRERTAENKMKAIVLIVSVMMIVTLVRCLAKFLQGYLAQKTVYLALYQLRGDLFAHVTRMPVGCFTHERPSDSVSRMLKDVAVLGEALKLMLGKAVREPLNAFCMLGFAMLMDWKLTLLFLGSGPLVLVLVSKVGRHTKHASRRLLAAFAQMLGKLQETVAALKVIKVYNRQPYEHQSFQTINQRLLKQQLRIAGLESATSPTIEILGMAVASAAVILGTYWITRADAIDGAVFLALLVLLGAAADAAHKSSGVWIRIQHGSAAAERVFALLDQRTESEAPDAVTMPAFAKALAFEDVGFTYPGAREPVLKGIDLTIQAGQKTAIVGPNGAGKTSLVNLLPRFYDVDSGRITIDGRDIRQVTLSSLRAQIGMVTQEVISFNDSVARNIAYGKSGAHQAEIMRAARQAFAHEFIQNLPQGYDTILGEQGSGLSGGQLQRILIARAIIKDPAILIFDEATSQIDADSESKIHAALESLSKDRTTLIIAHRLGTVMAADSIVVMDQGRIVAHGRHDDLYATCQLYQRLYQTQLMGA